MRIAHIEDHKLLSESVKKILEEKLSFAEIQLYETADIFFERLPIKSPDIIITDLLMPGMIDGLKLIELCQHKFEVKPKIIVLSSITDVQTIKQAIRNGAKGYLSKNIPSDELIIAIQEVFNDNQYISAGLRDSLLHTMFVEEQIIFHLSPREKEVLNYVCSGLTIKEIAYNLKLSTHTVQYYHKNVLTKLKLKRTSDLIVFAMQHGLFIPNFDKKK